MPDPQPGWCQQYTQQMVPMWARKFEPPAVSGWESQDAMRTLIRIARVTGDKKYLEPIPKALAYFNKSLLPDGRVARFYELRTNKPLYMNARYELTHDDTAAPDHYGWKQPARFKEIEALYDARFYRMWQFYLAGAQVSFEHGGMCKGAMTSLTLEILAR